MEITLSDEQIVSIPAPAWGATASTTMKLPRRMSFNSRPRVGGDHDTARLALLFADVSIPAPAWGATARARQSHHRPRVSILAPAQGATEDVRW